MTWTAQMGVGDDFFMNSGVSSRVFVHAHGLCESEHVGTGTRIWAFAHVLAGAKIGRGERQGARHRFRSRVPYVPHLRLGTSQGRRAYGSPNID